MSALPFVPSRRGLLFGAGALALAGCAPTRTRLVAGHEAGLRYPALQGVLNGWVADGRLSGAAIGLRHGDGPETFLQAGRLDHDLTSALVDRNTLFRIYSMTKPITGVGAALLIEDGRLDLDTPVADLVPEVGRVEVARNPDRGLDGRAPASPMTVRHLLTHTAGLTYHFFDGPIADAYRRAGLFPVTGYSLAEKPIDGPKVHDLDEFGRRLGEIPLRFDPGTEYHYSIGLDLLGLVIQRASGMSFPDFLQRRLFNPIGMRDTLWEISRADQARLMALYDYSGGQRIVRDDRTDSAYARPVTLFAGGAGLISTASDYLAFLTMLLDDGRAGSVRVMTPETARMVRTDILPSGVEPENGAFRFGFGGSVKEPSGEYGWGGAAGTIGWMNPTTRTALTVMVQHFGQRIDVDGDVRRALERDVGEPA